jgi:hypothetical protein
VAIGKPSAWATVPSASTLVAYTSVTAAPGRGNFSVVYERSIADQPYGTNRALMRRVTPK